MPRVLLDLRMVEGRLHGIARYALELARRLPVLRPEWDFAALTGPGGLPRDLGPLAPRLPEVRCRARFLSALEQPALAVSLAQARCDLFHATSFSLPLLWGGPLVATLHDANHLALPQNYGPGQLAYYRVVVGPRARSAKALLTVSGFSRRELARHLGLPEERFQVISPGVDFSRPSAEQVAEVRRAHRLPPRYFLAVGNPKPHKNLALLARIAARLPAPLVLLAGPGAAAELGFPPGTIELAEVSERELPALYAGAIAHLLPSRYEGFGLPAIEAMAAGCPGVVADAGALPEVVGDAATRLSPDDAEAWLAEAARLARDDQARQTLIERGLARAARFDWGDCAQRTLAVYERVLERGAR